MMIMMMMMVMMMMMMMMMIMTMVVMMTTMMMIMMTMMMIMIMTTIIIKKMIVMTMTNFQLMEVRVSLLDRIKDIRKGEEEVTFLAQIKANTNITQSKYRCKHEQEYTPKQIQIQRKANTNERKDIRKGDEEVAFFNTNQSKYKYKCKSK